MDNTNFPFCKTTTILPLTFNDSISYYEQLSKMCLTINQLISLFNQGVDTEIQKYIDERFNNLMINAIYDFATETIYLKKGTLNG